MATPHDDDAPPAPNDTVTADLDLVDRLDREARESGMGTPAAQSAGDRLSTMGRTLLPRLARELRQAREALATARDHARHASEQTNILEDAAYLKGKADGRREAQEEAARATCAATEAAAQEIDAAHGKGRRDAIEEAAQHLRAHRDMCVEKLKAETDEGEREALDLTREILDAAAVGIEAHEAERARRSK